MYAGKGTVYNKQLFPYRKGKGTACKVQEEEIRCETEGEAKKLLLLEREEMEQKEPVQELLEQDRRIREAKERLQVLKEEKRMARRIQKMDIRTTTEKMLEKAVTKQREVRK